jgi:hypothetical protein
MTIDEIQSPLGVTWRAVRARSEQYGCYCADCYFMFAAGGVPCRKHTLPDEADARERVIADAGRAADALIARRP